MATASIDSNLLRVRVTGILIEGDTILIVKQKVSAQRNWSLPGGKVEAGETLENAIIRELHEETGLVVSVDKLLYICELPEANPALIHITFLLNKVSGQPRQPTNEYETTPINEVKMVPVAELEQYEFSGKFIDLINKGFPAAGSYMGHKRNIGL